MGLIRFDTWAEKATFHSPLAGMDLAHSEVQVRRDPLTGQTAVASEDLAKKAELFFGTTDWERAEELAARTKPGCFFCREAVEKGTPRYPDELLPGGRLERGPALVFPNLFPLAAVHAVACWPDHHFLRPSQFTPELLEAGLGAAVEFAGRAEAHFDGLVHISICCNNLPPAGASVVHPHLQVYGGRTTPWLVETFWSRSADFLREHRVSYWRALVDEEEALGERSIAVQDGVHWLAPFAPTGGREVLAVLPDREHLAELGPEQVAALADGLSRVLGWYESRGLSAFNYTLYSAPLDGRRAGFPVLLRIVARAAFRVDYRCDDYFLQRQLGSELVLDPPERMAAELRGVFAAG